MSDPSQPASLAYRTVTVTAIVIAMVLLVLVLYVASSAFFLVFASLLLGAIFRGLAHLLERVGLPQGLALVVVYLLALLLIAAPLALGGLALVQQFNALLGGVEAQANNLVDMLNDMGLPVGPSAGEAQGDLRTLLPDPSGIFSSASQALFSFLGGLGNLFVVVFLAIFISWQPRLYRDGFVSLFPSPKRARLAETLHEGARSLMMWVAGAGISMATVFAVSWIGLFLIGMPYAFALALQAGLLAFIPTLGAFAAGIVIVLSGLTVSPEMALWALGVYVLIQGIESNVTTPIAQRWATSLPPALTLAFQVVFGLLFGLLGFVMAVPFLAVAVVFVRKLYVEDVLGGPVERTE